MKIRIPYSKSQSKEEAFEFLKNKISEETLKKMKVEADLQFYEDSHQLRAEGKGFSLNLYCYDNEAEVSLDLGFLLKPFKGKIEDTIKSKISKIV